MKLRQKQKINCTSVEGLFRILQSVPSKKVEKFKRWLAKVGYERLQEYDNPELAFKRAYANYVAKGYPQEWIDKRIQSKKSAYQRMGQQKYIIINALKVKSMQY